jgi:hypothetical protein
MPSVLDSRQQHRKYGTEFERAASGITILRTPIRAPKANAMCERFLGSVRRECLDHVLVFNERHLPRVIKEYVAYFNAVRPHKASRVRLRYHRPARILRPPPTAKSSHFRCLVGCTATIDELRETQFPPQICEVAPTGEASISQA